MIDKHAVVSPQAKLAPDVQVGPYTVIGPDVEIGEGTWIGPHVVINGTTRIGKNNKIYQFAAIGDDPQDKKYNGETTYLEVGDNNVFREFCTVHRGSVQGESTTHIGNDNYFMAYTHVAHDCHIGNNVIMANCANIAGHVIVDDYAYLGAFTGVHQNTKIGAHCYISRSCCVTKDILPYVLVAGHDAKTYGLNTVGLKRRGFSSEAIEALQRAYKIIFRQNLLVEESIERLKPLAAQHPEAKLMLDGLLHSERGVIR